MAHLSAIYFPNHDTVGIGGLVNTATAHAWAQTVASAIIQFQDTVQSGKSNTLAKHGWGIVESSAAEKIQIRFTVEKLLDKQIKNVRLK